MAAISLYVLTFNCGRALINPEAFASQLFSGLTTSKLPDLVVLSLQEIAPVPHSLIGGSFLVPYFERFHNAVQKGAEKVSGVAGNAATYTPIAARNLGMTAIMVFAKDPTTIQTIETSGLGVGIAEMGNKGAIGVRFTYQEAGNSTELTFVAAHLAPMEDGLARRNEDWKSIVRGLVFSSTAKNSRKSATSLSGLSGEERPLLSTSSRNASIYKPTSHLFVSGDLNYRTSIMSPAPSDHIDTFPQPHQDESSPYHFSKLLENDQLKQELLAGRTCHGLIEAPITFPPTYKYEIKEPFLTSDEDLARWNWAKHRWPSWCDRILYLDIPSWLKQNKPEAIIVVYKYTALPLLPTSDHRPVTAEFSVPLIPIPSPSEEEVGDDPRISPPFDLDIDWKAKRDRARTLELIVGFTMYFTTTLEGGSVATATIVGAVGAFFVIKALVDF